MKIKNKKCIMIKSIISFATIIKFDFDIYFTQKVKTIFIQIPFMACSLCFETVEF